MYRFSFIFSFIFVISLSLSGCESNSISETDTNHADFIQLSTNESIDQQPSNEAKQALEGFGEISTIRAVNSDEKIVIAFEVDHLQRLQLKDIKKKVKKKIEKELSNLKSVVSTDKKIILELEKLERKVQANEISKKKLNKKVDKIIKLSEEQT